ncbi:transposase family protein [Enterococcus sp. AZ196]|uniref:transposase family protein n=1 Tax=Enterococcus sp. AZ196 TaxID=2774659 RepID=UPI003D2A1457
MCPACEQSTTRVHVYYDRTIQDLPVNGKPVYLKIRCRKLLCHNKKMCEQVFFTTGSMCPT